MKSKYIVTRFPFLRRPEQTWTHIKNHPIRTGVIVVWYLIQIIRWEVPGIGDASQLRHVRRPHVPDVIPVDAVEEGMGLDFTGATAAKAMLWVANEPLERTNEDWEKVQSKNVTMVRLKSFRSAQCTSGSNSPHRNSGVCHQGNRGVRAS